MFFQSASAATYLVRLEFRSVVVNVRNSNDGVADGDKTHSRHVSHLQSQLNRLHHLRTQHTSLEVTGSRCSLLPFVSVSGVRSTFLSADYVLKRSINSRLGLAPRLVCRWLLFCCWCQTWSCWCCWVGRSPGQWRSNSELRYPSLDHQHLLLTPASLKYLRRKKQTTTRRFHFLSCKQTASLKGKV